MELNDREKCVVVTALLRTALTNPEEFGDDVNRVIAKLGLKVEYDETLQYYYDRAKEIQAKSPDG